MGKFQDVKVVIFDYGNTLIYDPFIDIFKGKFVKFIASKIKRDEKKVRYAFTKANSEINYPHITHFMQEEPIAWHALESLGIDARDSLFLSLEIIKKYRQECRKLIRVYEKKGEIKKIIEYLFKKGKRLGIISNGRTVDIYSKLEWLKIKKYFDFVLSSEKFGIEKPDKRIFKQMIKLFKVKPSEILYVGDDPLRDVVPAKTLGMKVILCKPPKKYSKPMPWRKYNVKIKEKPDFVIKKFTELKELF